MTDRATILMCALAGTVVGGAAGYFLLTDEGRRMRADLEPRLVDLMGEFQKARALLDPGASSRGDASHFAR